MSEVMQVFDIQPLYEVEGDVGIEIEVEGNNLPRAPVMWRAERDGSLRGESVEYVLRKPLDMDACRYSLNALNAAYLKNGTTVNESVRAGVHVHINVQKLSLIELFSFITAYVILEDLLIKYCGEYREGNLFCLRTRDAEYLMYTLERVARTKEFLPLRDDLLRYSSMNVCSLFAYGSLEFRAMRGTRDLTLIGDWAEILLGVRDVAKSFDNPASIVEFLEEKGSEAFLEAFLGRFKENLCTPTDTSKLINEGLVRVYPLATFPDWETFKRVDIGGLMFPMGTEYPDEPLQDY
jgi:hypothetical protein